MSFNIEEFFNSIDVIVEQRLADLSYDTTVIATITDDSDKEHGHYIVTDGTIRFDAYVNDMNYKTGDQVRVTIMNGDWSQKKFIVGLYTDNGTGKAVTYIPPLGNVFATDYSKSTAELNSNKNFTLYANGSETYKQIWGKQITKDSSEYILQANGVYNVITLSGDFQTSLGALSAGGYGLKLELYIQPEVDSTDRIMKFITFDSSEMIGNPYQFVIDSRQEKQFTIASQGIVTEIILSVYQGIKYDDENNTIDNLFYDADGNILFNTGTQFPIYFKNISVGFGSNLTEIEDNTLKIYTTGSTTYKYCDGNGDETNNKHLGLVWYNKDELDGYVGFSDGIVDSDYDEIQYLKASYADTRLTRNANKGTIANDELSLTLAANIEDSEPYMQNVYKALTTDLSTELQALGRQLTGWPTLQTELNKFISAWGEGAEKNTALLTEARNTAETAVENLATLYADVLQHAYNLQNDVYKNATERSEAWNKITFNDYYTTFYNAVEGVLTQIEAFFTTMKQQTEVGQAMSGYRTVYSNYYNRVKTVIQTIRLNLSNIIHSSEVYGSKKEDYVWLQGCNSRTDDFPSYVKDEEYFAEFANRYCIYWYRYNEKYNLEYIVPLTQTEWNNLPADQKKDANYSAYVTACNKNNDEYQFGRFLGANWERIQVDSSANSIVNFGLPGPGDTIDGIQYLRPSSPSELLLYRKMEPTTQIEKYQVVLFYNHVMCKSNTLTFTNLEADKIPPEFAVDAADILRIEHDTYSQDHYQAYSQANDLVNIADESRIRQLKCFYEGVLYGDEALAGADIYWYIPTNSTMLTYDKNYLVRQGFTTDDTEPDEDGNTGKTEYSKNGYVYFSRTIGYTNTPTEVTDSEGNKIYDATGKIVTEDNITITESDKYFFYKIKPYYEAAAQNNTILVEAHIKKGDEVKVTTGEIPFTFSTFGTNGTKYTLVLVPDTTQIATYPHSDTNPNPNLMLELTLRDADNNLIPLDSAAVVVPEYVGGEVEEPEEDPPIQTYNLQLSWKTHNSILQNSGLTLTPVGEDKTTYSITIPNPQFGTGIPYVGILNASVMFNEELSNGEERQIRLKTFYPVAYSSAVEAEYYISGPTTIVYDNQGVVSRLTDEPYKLYQHTLENGDVEVTNCSWELAYFKANGTQLVEGNTEDSKKTYKELIAYMPKLNADNTLMPAPMYCSLYDEEDKETFIVPVAICKVGNNIVWTQPIIITQNNYASSTLNEWNGEFEINEANGTILSTMVGAGRKNVDNQFEGVLMGDIEKGANFDSDNASGLGIYGFHQGNQSFYFGIDGKAFLGKAGRGRINFDGNSGTISSASYESQRVKNEDGTYENHDTAGMLIDLDDGIIDMKGTSYAGGHYNPKVTKLSADEYAELWEGEPAGSYPTYEEYETQFNQDATEIVRKQSHIRLDVKGTAQDGYFYIHSSKQHLPNKHLMFIGDEEYYLQTDDYDTTEFNYNDGGAAGDGAGFKLDLANSLLNAYKLKITSKNLFLNSTSDGIEPYFVIKHNEDKNEDGTPTEKNYKNLFYVGSNNYYLQSANYIPMTSGTNEHMGQGMRLDLAGNNPKITAYNFDLRAGNVRGGSTKDATTLDVYLGSHEIVITDQGTSDGNPYFQINTVDSNDKTKVKTLVNITQSEQSLQSADYLAPTSSAHGKGMRISLSGKELKAYSGFTLQAYQSETSNNCITIDATASHYPLLISGQSQVENEDGTTSTVNRNFKVNWNGALEATGATITGTINATGGTFSGNLTVTGTLNGGTILGAEIYGATIANAKENATFSVNSSGHLVAASANIGGWNVTGGSGGFTNGAFTMHPTSGLDFNDNFTVDANGNMRANSAILNALTVYESLTVNSGSAGTGGGGGDGGNIGGGSGNANANAQIKMMSPRAAVVAPDAGGASSVGGVTNALVTINGETKLGGNIEVDGTTKLGGNTEVTGTLKIDSATTISGATDITGTTTITGDTSIEGTTTITGDTDVTGKMTAANVVFTNTIQCTNGDGETGATVGVDGNFEIDGRGWFGGYYNFVFRKGILVSTAGSTGDQAAPDGTALPGFSTANAGQVLTVDSNGALGWTFLKKKFNLSLSGTIKNANHNYYVLDSATGGSYTTYKKVGIYKEGTKAWPEKVTNYSGWVIKCSGENNYHYKSNPNISYYYEVDSTAYYSTYKKAGDITITSTKDDYEVTLQGGDSADNAIVVAISDATLSID